MTRKHWRSRRKMLVASPAPAAENRHPRLSKGLGLGRGQGSLEVGEEARRQAKQDGAAVRHMLNEAGDTGECGMTCPFCLHVVSGHEPWVDELENAIAFHDAYPSGAGHILIIPRRHVGRLYELTADERRDMFALLEGQLFQLARYAEGCTVGINDGEAAGQTVPHVHLHIIPRHPGDTANARGGIRWAIPETADYWSAREALG